MKNSFLLIFVLVSFKGFAQNKDFLLNKNREIEPSLYNPENIYKVTSEVQPLTVVEKMPEFIGGQTDMMKFISNNLVYPQEAKNNKIEGSVFVKFTVAATGEKIDVHSIKKIKLGYGCEEAAIEIIKKMPNWNPGKQNGTAVAVYFILPIKFQLD